MRAMPKTAPTGPLAVGFEPAPLDNPAWQRARSLISGCLSPWCVSRRVQAQVAVWPDADIETLIDCARFHGMTPLLALHGRGAASSRLRRAWAPVLAREAHVSRVRLAVLEQIVSGCAEGGARVLLLKGAGLALTAYPEPTLRPMRDLDLMAEPGRAAVLAEVMAGMGFVDAGPKVPSGHHHGTPGVLVRDHVRVYVEPHKDLGLSPRVNVAARALFAAAAACDVNGARGFTPGLEHMLWHVYRHGFTMPFTTEATKLIWLADLHVLTESHAADPALHAALRARPRLRRVLAAMHAVVPWSPAVQRALAPAPLGRFTQLGDYAGWPRTEFCAQAWRATLLPPDFWLAMRQGARVGFGARPLMYVRHWRDLLQKGVASQREAGTRDCTAV